MLRSLLLAAPLLAVAGFVSLPAADPPPVPEEAPSGFGLVTNGFTSQTEFDANRLQFEEDATVQPTDESGGGLGPTYNGTSCKQCHLNPSTGGGLSRFELRAGRLDPATGAFIAPPGGTLVRQLATDPAAQQRVPDGFFTTKRRSTSLFGLGYVEAIPDAAIQAVAAAQPPEVRGVVVMADTLGSVGPDGQPVMVKGVGRFGWKCQQRSLFVFAGDADLNEKGITNVFFPREAPAVDGRSLSPFDPTAEPEDASTADAPLGKDITAYTLFMRSLKAPSRDFSLQLTDDVRAGERLFAQVGCAVCHVPTWATAPTGATLPGYATVRAAVGSKLIHPYSDFLLHDVGTGDTEVVQGGGPETRRMLRTAPLWGVRLVPEMGHDGRWTTFSDAVEGHAGQAAGARANYRLLTPGEQRQVVAFLRSL